MNTLPKIALGAWAWGNDGTFGGNLTADTLRPIFEAGMAHGLNLWDTASAQGGDHRGVHHGTGCCQQILQCYRNRDHRNLSEKIFPGKVI